MTRQKKPVHRVQMTEGKRNIIHQLLEECIEGSSQWSNKIKVNSFGDEYETYTIKLNDNQNVLIISPAFTSVDDSETWYYIE